jgi:tetratricopeptide (TPR) repeat protein
LLERAATDVDLMAAHEMEDVKARVFSLLAQALMHDGQTQQATVWIRKALRIVRALKDKDGLAEVRNLQSDVMASIMAEQQEQLRSRELLALASLSIDEVRKRGDGPAQQASWLIKKANAEIEASRCDVALAVAQEALGLAELAQDVREQVLALLSAARAAPESAHGHLHQAWQVAERANEFTLIGAVARAAEASDVTLPTLHGPEVIG